MNRMIEIGGSRGEGGGQVLRTALSLSCITGKDIVTEVSGTSEGPGIVKIMQAGG